MNNWRLTGEVSVYLVNDNQIYLASPEKKQYQTAVLKQIGNNSYSEIVLTGPKFVARVVNFSATFMFLVKSDDLPDPDTWYTVVNFYKPSIWPIISQLNINAGVIEGQTFEAVFSEDGKYECAFISSDMLEYKSAREEMKRRMNCEIFKKTKKWIPGHRYDSLKETYYYLGKVMSRKSDEFSSDYISDPLSMVEVHLVVNNLKDTDKNISDILKTRCYGYNEDDIKVLWKLPSCVDSGEAINDDLGDDIMVYWDNMLDNAINYCSSNLEGYTNYIEHSTIFNIFAFQSLGKTTYPAHILEKVEGVLNSMVYDIIINYWNLERFRGDTIINSKNSSTENVTNGLNLFYSLLGDLNIQKNVYYKNLFEKGFKINLKAIIEKQLDNWDEASLSLTFEDYVKNISYFHKRADHLKYTSQQRVLSTNYKLDIITLEDLFSNTELKNTLIDIVNSARNNYGLGVQEFVTSNIGTKKNPIEYTKCVITLSDLIKHKKGMSGISETLKNEIMASKFCTVSILFDKDGEIK